MAAGLAGTTNAQRKVPANERAPILKAYLSRAVGGRPHIPVDPAAPVAAFEAVAAAYPAFRIATDASGLS